MLGRKILKSDKMHHIFIKIHVHFYQYIFINYTHKCMVFLSAHVFWSRHGHVLLWHFKKNDAEVLLWAHLLSVMGTASAEGPLGYCVFKDHSLAEKVLRMEWWELNEWCLSYSVLSTDTVYKLRRQRSKMYLKLGSKTRWTQRKVDSPVRCASGWN